jgi:ABC-type glycerol-3-phosphate transport system substrate-binding protein
MGVGAAALLNPWRGCAKSEADQDPVTLWHIWPDSEGQPVREVLSTYSRNHPELLLQPQSVSTNNLKAKLLGAARSGSLPEIFALNSSWIKDLHPNENLVDLLPLLKAEGLDPKALLRPWDHERCMQGGSMFCLPATSASGTSMLFTNLEKLQAIGLQEATRFQNWAEFTEASRELVRRCNPDGLLKTIALDPYMGPGMVIHSSLAAGIGAPTISRDGRNALLKTEGSLRVAHALDDYVTRVYGFYGGYRALLEWRFRYAGLHRQPAFSSLPYDSQIFAIAAAGSLARYRRFLPMRNLVVQPVPGLDRLHGGMASHNWSYSMSKHAAQHHPGAWKLLRHLTIEEEGVGRFCRLYGRPSPLIEASDSAYYQEWGKVWEGVKEAVSLDIPYPASSEDEFLRYHLFLVPMRRLRGEHVEEIYSDLDAQYQVYLDSSIG